MSSVERFLRLALFSTLFLLFLLPGPRCSAQVTATAPPLSTTLADYNNRWDAFGGFSYARFNTTVGHALKTNMYGFKLQGTAWLNPIVGFSAATGNYYGTVPLAANPYSLTSASISEHLFLFGPEFRLLRDPKWTVDAHVLLGGTYGIFDNSYQKSKIDPNSVGLYNNQLAFAAAAGGSFDYNVNPKYSARLIVDFQPTRYGLAFQKDASVSIGVVYKWGAIKK